MDRRREEVFKLGKRPGVNASTCVKPSDMQKAYEAGTIGRNNPDALITSVWLVLTQQCGMRAKQEVRNVLNADIVFSTETSEGGIPKFVEVQERITKTRRGGNNEVREVAGKAWRDDDYPDICPVRTIMEYERRKKKIQKSHNCPFLLGVNQQARSNPDGTLYWYINSPMGVNTITSLLKNALEGAGVDLRNQKITASSSRKNLVQAGADSQVPGHWLSKYMGHKNVNS